MDKQTNDIGKPFMEVVTNKLERQDEKIAGLEERIKKIPDHFDDFERVKKEFTELKSMVANISFPVNEMHELSTSLHTSVKLLKQPVQEKVLHHHYIPKLFWITIGLALLACLFFVMWLLAGENLDQYKSNDTKYRYLKLQENQNLKELLYNTDSIYLVTPGLRDSVEQRERQNMRNLEMLQEAMKKEQEAKELREKVKGK
jgi:hypothetical protein